MVIEYQDDAKTQPIKRPVDYMNDFMLFAFLWVVIYLKDTNVFVLMASVSTYYFDSGPNGEGSAQVKLSMGWAHTTHAGSIALGSMIQAILCLTIYPIMWYADTCLDSKCPPCRA